MRGVPKRPTCWHLGWSSNKMAAPQIRRSSMTSWNVPAPFSCIAPNISFKADGYAAA